LVGSLGFKCVCEYLLYDSISMSQVGLDFWWIFLIGTSVVLTLGITLVVMVMLHQKTKFKLEMEKYNLIKASEQKYNDLFNNVSDIIYIHSLEGKILDVNLNASRLFGLDMRDITGKSLYEVFPKKNHHQVYTYLEKIAACNSDEMVGLFSIKSKKDRRIYVFEYKSSVVRENGQMVAVRGVARNVTERMESERSLRKAKDRMEQMFMQSRIMQEKLSELSRESIQMLEEERRNISRELHDEVGQLLTAMKVNLEIMKKIQKDRNGQLQQIIGETEDIIGEVFNRVHHFLHELRPVAIDEVGFIGAINRFADEFSNRSGIKVIIEDDESAEGLTIEQKISLYRIIQESFANVVKHSKADKIILTMKPEGQYLIMEVQDNGVGFIIEEKGKQSTNQEKRLGLLGMEERAKLARGELKIVSKRGSGTTVRIRIPIVNK